MKKMKAHLLATLTLALGLGSSVEVAYAKKSQSSKKKAKSSSEAENKSAQTKIEATESAKVPFAKPAQGSSVDSRLRFGTAISTTQNDELLGVGRVGPVSTRTVSFDKAQEEAKRLAKNLNIGLFRSEQLTEGKVAAPGVADFAAYFRGSNRTSGAKDAAKVKSDAPVMLGAASSEQLAREAEAENLRLQTVESIHQILKTKPNADARFTLLTRLAELQVERHAYLLEVEIKDFQESHERWKSTGKGSEPKFKTDKSSAQLLSAIEALRSLATQFPNHDRAPEVLFNLGFLLTQMNNDSATLYFDRLIKRFPKSEYIPDTFLAMGEHHFSKMQFDKALSYYQKVLSYKDTSAYNYAVYKLGWTYFNLREKSSGDSEKNLSKSLSAFRLVVKLAENTTDPVLKDLRKEALKDMILVFTDLGDIDTAQKYYESLGEPKLYHALLERLAWQNSERGHYDKAVAIYERLIAETATDPKLPTIYAKVPELLEKQNKRAKLLQFLAHMSTSLSADSKWGQANKQNAESQEEKNKVLSKEFLTWAQKFHAEAQKSGRERTYDEALVAYNIYLDNFGETAQSYSAHFYKAEIFVQKGKYVEASDSYLKSVSIDEKYSLNGKFTKDALLNSIQCIDTVLAKSPQVKLAEAGRAQQKIPYTALHERLMRSLDGFTRHFPTEEKALKIAHRAASIAYAFGDYNDANARWTSLALKHPRSEEVFDGARLVLKVSVLKQDWATAVNESRKFLAIKGIKESRLGAEIIVVLKGSVFQRALALEKQEKRAEAADMFLAYHKEFQDDADAPKALFNAANNKFRVGKVDEALAALRIILAQYPNSSLAPNTLYLIATSYDALGEFANSAANYEQLASDVPQSPVTPEALLRAAEHRLAIGDFVQAQKNATTLVKNYPNSDKASQGHVIIGMAQERMNNHKEAAEAFAQGAEKNLSSNAPYSLLLYGMAARAAHAQGMESQAEQFCKQGEKILSSLGDKIKDPNAQEGVRLIGTTTVALLDSKLPSLYKQSITNSTQLNAQFAKIRDDVQKLAVRYVAVAKQGNAEAGIGALYRVAEMQEFLGTLLLKAPAPANAKAEEVETFRSSLERIAFPLQEEAANLYVTAWQKANETEAMTPYTKKLYEKLVVLKPAEFKPIVEDMPTPSYFSSEVVVAPETKKLMRE